MSRRILALIFPASLLAFVAAIPLTRWRPRSGWLGDEANWNTLLFLGSAVLLLALTVLALRFRARKFAIPCFVAFLVQLLGAVLVYFKQVGAGEYLWPFAVAVVGFTVFLVLLIWLISTLRARYLETKIREGLGGTSSAGKEELERLRKDMNDALTLLRKAGRGGNAIYELPWFMVIGRPAAGKTVAIKESGLGLPVRKDWIKGTGGTFTVDWFFTNKMIFLDTPGAWVTDGATDEGRVRWKEQLRLLRKHRGRCPLDGLIVTVPADDLLGATEEELEEQAGHVREVIDLIQGELRFRLPVYLLVSKCDLVAGFVDFFKGLPAQRRHEIFGWSNPEPKSPDVRRLVSTAMGGLIQRLQAYRLEMIARANSSSRARRLFFFTEEVRRIRQPLALFAEILFYRDPSHETPVFRGFYLSSGTQGEGAPLRQAMDQMARTLGIRAMPPPDAKEEEPKRAYFLLDLFRELMVKDEGLVGRTVFHWLKRRRDTALVVFLPAALAAGLLLLSLLSFLWNRSVYDQIGSQTGQIVEQLRSESTGLFNKGAADAVEQSAKLHENLERLTRLSLLGFLGMRRPGDLAVQAQTVFEREFTRNILDPTLQRAEEQARKGSTGCDTRVKILNGVAWLAKGEKIEPAGAPVRILTDDWAVTSERSDEVRGAFVRQSGALPSAAHFPIDDIARSVAEGCADVAKLTGKDELDRFQRNCAQATGCKVITCFESLNRAVRNATGDPRQLRDGLNVIKDTLNRLDAKRQSVRTHSAIASLASIESPSGETSKCGKTFYNEVFSRLGVIVGKQEELIADCQRSLPNPAGQMMRVADKVKQQDEDLKSDWDGLEKAANSFEKGDCKTEIALRVARGSLEEPFRAYRRAMCQGDDQNCEDNRSQEKQGGIRDTQKEKTQDLITIPIPPKVAYLTRPSGVSAAYSADEWERQKVDWADLIAFTARTDVSPQEKTQRLVQLQGRVNIYASRYEGAWRNYLGGIKLRPREPGVAVETWVKDLSQTSEYADLLQPASEALSAGQSDGPPLDGLRQRLSGLNLGEVIVSLGKYQAHLGDMSADLSLCRTDNSRLIELRRALQNNEPDTSFYRARQWVSQNAGGSVASGKLNQLFLDPIEEAEKELNRMDESGPQWDQLLDAYARWSTLLPFAGQATGQMEDDDLTTVFGGSSGLVSALRGSDALTALKRDWIEKASVITDLFYKKGKDERRKLVIRFTLKSPGYDPPKAAHDFVLREINLLAADGTNLLWDELDTISFPETRELQVDSQMNGQAKIRVEIAEKKLIGKPTPVSPSPSRVEQGPWAIAKLIKKNLRPIDADQSTPGLEFTFDLTDQKNADKRKKLILHFTLDGRDLDKLLEIWEHGLPPPPRAEAQGD